MIKKKRVIDSENKKYNQKRLAIKSGLIWTTYYLVVLNFKLENYRYKSLKFVRLWKN